jgi:hypothetical protein
MDVGTDWQTYYSLAAGERSAVVYFNKGEFIFYYIFKIFSEKNINPQFFFVLISFVNAALFSNFIRVLRSRYKIPLFWFIFYVFVVSGATHNQLNIIRTFTAIFIFLNAACYRFEGGYTKTIFFVILGFLAHQSFILAVPFLLIPIRTYNWLYRKPTFLIISSSIFYLFVLTPSFSSFILSHFLPFYSKYVDRLSQGLGLSLNFLTKLYYLPFIFFVLFKIKKSNIDIPERLVPYFVIWLLTCMMFLSLYNTSLIFRAYSYFTIFGAFPAAYFIYFSSSLVRNLFLVYFLFPYVVKVFLFPVGEYHYKSILGPICEFSWSMSQC